MNARARKLRALALLAALALGNAGLVAFALPAQAASPCHEVADSGSLRGDERCQWASPTSCCDALSAVQAGPELELPALAPAFVLAPPAPLCAPYAGALAEPEERVPLLPRSPILRL